MRKQMIIPDELAARVSDEAKAKNMNFTQYTVQALTRAVEADAFVRSQPEIKAKLTELSEMLSKVQAE